MACGGLADGTARKGDALDDARAELRARAERTEAELTRTLAELDRVRAELMQERQAARQSDARS